MTFITLAMMTLLCLFMPLTRLYGVIGSVITLYFYPYQTLALLGALLIAMGAYFYFNHRRKRRAY